MTDVSKIVSSGEVKKSKLQPQVQTQYVENLPQKIANGTEADSKDAERGLIVEHSDSGSIDAEIADARAAAQAQAVAEIAEMHRLMKEQMDLFNEVRLDESRPNKEEVNGSVSDGKSSAPNNDTASLKLEPGFEYLMDMSTKELKKLAKSDNPVVARNVNNVLESRKHERNIWTPTELSQNERRMTDLAVEASGVDKPFYKNSKAQQILKQQLKEKDYKIVVSLYKKIDEAKTDEERQALKAFLDVFENKVLLAKYAKNVVKDLKIADQVEHTIVVDSIKDKKDVKQKLGAEADDFRIKTHNKSFMKHNAEVRYSMASKGISSHQAVYEQLSGSEEDPRRISGDRTFEKSEIYTAASYASDDRSRYLTVRNELRKLGYKVDDDLVKKIVMPVVSAIAGVAGGALFTGSLSTIVDVTATAFAEAVVNIPGYVGVNTTTTSTANTSVEINHWQNASVASATATAISLALFSDESEEIDLLRNHDRCDLFRDIPDGNGGTVRAYEVASFGAKRKTESAKAILHEIDSLKLSDEEKVALLNKAAGDKGLGKLTAKELVLAYIHGLDKVAQSNMPLTDDKPDRSGVQPEDNNKYIKHYADNDEADFV